MAISKTVILDSPDKGLKGVDDDLGGVVGRHVVDAAGEDNVHRITRTRI